MTFWEFLDKQFSRLRVEHVAGGGVFILTFVILLMIRENPDIAKDDLFKMLAQAVIVQGLVGLAMAAWFTKKNNGASGKTDDPVHTKEED